MLPVPAQHRAGHQHQPLGKHDKRIDDKPRLEVVVEDPPVVVDVLASLVVAKEETLGHVSCPEEQVDPLHDVAESGLRGLERQDEGQREEVKRDQNEAADIPGKAEVAIGADRGLAYVLLFGHFLLGVQKSAVLLPLLVGCPELVDTLAPRVVVDLPLPDLVDVEPLPRDDVLQGEDPLPNAFASSLGPIVRRRAIGARRLAISVV
mmetsp:Transcript_40301/g.108927  ORF Transcript_40301/g.108927 Transcript_40301/m.108927 type:complete len:206 (-) Transcript_40301:312-929(-)